MRVSWIITPAEKRSSWSEPDIRAEDHWHRYNPDSTGDIDRYLDAKGNSVPNGHSDSHLYPR